MKFKVPAKTHQLVKIAVPCFIEQLLNSVVGIISAMILGRLGKSELTAVNMTNNIVNWLQAVFTGLALGSTVVIARMWGSNDRKGVQNTFMHSLALNTSIAVILMLFLVIFQEQVIQFFFGSAEESVKNCMRQYFTLTIMRIPATAVANIICASERGVGDNKTSVYNSMLFQLIYIAIVYPLIYGIPDLNIPAMGVTGGALAGFIGTYVSATIIALYVVICRKPIIPDKFRFNFDKGIFKRVFNVGIPSSAEQFMFNGGFVILQTVLLSFGTVFQAGYQIGSNLNSIICVPSNAMCIAITALTSQALGRSNKKEALENVKASRFLYVIIFSVLSLTVFLLSENIARLYSTDEAVIREGMFFIRVFTFESFAVGYLQTMVGVLRGAGDNKYTLVTSIFGLWVCRVFGSWMLSRIMDPHIAVLIGLSAEFYLRAILYHIRVQKKKWLEIAV